MVILRAEETYEEEGYEGERGIILSDDGKWIGDYNVIFKGKTFYIHWLGIIHDEQGKGYGRQAFDQLVQRAKDERFLRIELQALGEKATTFWTHHGFKPVPGTQGSLLHRPVHVRQHRRRR